MNQSEVEIGRDVGGLIEAGEAFERLRANPAKRQSGRTFHTRMAGAFLLTALAGFAPTYYLKGITHAPPLRPLLHVHGLVFSAWLVLLLTQSALVAAHRVDIHRRLGIFGAALAALMVPLGLIVAIDSARHRHTIEILVFQFGAIALFVAFFGAALWNRRRPEFHRRLILLATVNLMPPAIVRLPLVGGSPIVAMLLSSLFVVAVIVHDVRSRVRVHPVTLWGGLLILISGPLRALLGQTDVWRSFARFLVEA